MEYGKILPGRFLARPNRFVALVETGAGTVTCHVKTTGRCAELLLPGAEVFLAAAEGEGRKTAFDLICVCKGERLVNIDSQAPNRIAPALFPAIFGENIFIKPEYRYKNSRLDFYIEAGGEKILVEVKGVTLEENGAALFPDAPTIRGLRHINELRESIGEGFRPFVIFIVQMGGVRYFTPNTPAQPEFARALSAAAGAGLCALAFDCAVTPGGIRPGAPLPVVL